MSNYQKKIMRHAKKQEIMTNTPKETKVGNRNFLWEQPDAWFNIKFSKITIINMFTKLKKIIFKEEKECLSSMLNSK